jgi:uncharacterized protein (DUF1786 family)
VAPIRWHFQYHPAHSQRSSRFQLWILLLPVPDCHLPLDLQTPPVPQALRSLSEGWRAAVASGTAAASGAAVASGTAAASGAAVASGTAAASGAAASGAAAASGTAAASGAAIASAAIMAS